MAEEELVVLTKAMAKSPLLSGPLTQICCSEGSYGSGEACSHCIASRACVPAACPEFSKPVSPGDATLGCECIENYEPRDLRWERVDSGWSGVCEGEWVVAARARAALFEFIGVCAVLGTVLIGGGCGAKRLRVRQVPGAAHLLWHT